MACCVCSSAHFREEGLVVFSWELMAAMRSTSDDAWLGMCMVQPSGTLHVVLSRACLTESCVHVRTSFDLRSMSEKCPVESCMKH